MNDIAADTGETGSRDVPIVGLGASAGGLQPLSTFLHAMPADAGLAYVVIVHLEPDHESLMSELLGRQTGMAVLEARDGQALEADHVYVIPPNREISVANATLHATAFTERRGLRTPIDTFFRSLANACGTRCVGIVLSGTGSDGAAGLREIKANGGLTLVQDPATAAHDGMPQAAIATGVIDLVCAAEQMPRAIDGFLRARPPDADALEGTSLPESMVDAVLNTLHAQRGTNFRRYKPTTLARRIQRRIDLNQCTEPAQYLFQLRDDPREADLLVRELLIGVTGFFRDRAAFDELEHLVIAPLVARCGRDEPLRIWVPGCSTGEEAYSIAILLAEQQRLQERHCQVQMFASDVHSDALEFARAGCFPSGIAADLEPEHLTRYFNEDASGRLVAQSALRDTITFARHDLLADPPFSRLHLVSCRNLLIYLKPQVQEQVLQLFHSALQSDGHLMLGSSETPTTHAGLFDPVSKKSRIYRRRDGLAPRWNSRSKRLEGSGRITTTAPGTRRPRIGDLAQRWIIKEFAPPIVVVNRRLDSLYFCGDMGRYLKIAQGEPNLNLMDIVRDGLASRVRGAVKQALDSGRDTEVERVRMRRNGGFATVRVRVKPLEGGTWSSEGLAMVCFDEPYAMAAATPAPQDSATPAADGTLVHELETELRYTREDLQSTIEELETSNEELQVSNETALSMNEELQSSNEELKASKEELQSVNEELSTVNAQLQEKLADLEEANDDLQNFLDSSDLAMLFLDRELRVRRYTHEATALFKLIPADRGRHLSDISSSLTDNDLSDIAREVLQSLAPHEATVHGRGGRWYVRRVRAYRTRDERASGVVVTYSDVTRLLESERLAGERLAELEAIYEQAPVGLTFLDPDLRIERINAQLAHFDGLTREAHLGQRPVDLLPQSVGARVQAHLESVHASGEALIDEEFRGELAGTPGIWRDWQASYYPVRATDHTLLGINAMVQDVTRRKQSERFLSAAREVSVALMNAGSETQLLEDSLAAVAKTFEARICEYWVPESEGGRFRIEHFHVPEASAEQRQRLEHAFDELRLPADDTLVGEAWSQARTRWVEDVTEHPDFVRADEAQDLGLVSGFALPVGSGDAVYGVMCFFTGHRLAVNPALESAVEALGRDVGHTIRRFRDSQRLRDADERKSRFLSVLGHELRNPLSSIANATELLAGGDAGMHDHALLVLRSGVATTSRLLDDLLDLERIELGKITLQRTRVNLSGPIRQAVWAVHESIDGKRQQLSIQLPQAALLVEGDALRLEQAIVNLLQNAVKYTPEHGFIEIAAYPEGEHAVVQVSDSGVGIGAQELGVIFEPFVQLPGDSPSNDGLGVGLSLVKQLVVLHGGRVSAHSEGSGRATTFTIHLPRVLHDEPLEPPAGDGVREDAGSETIDVRVLVVDDNTASAETLALILTDWGCQVRMAASAEQALEIAAQFAPEILVLDLGLPDMDGFELARRLDRAAAHPRLTIALSGFGDEQARSNAAQAGFDHFMVKPARLEQLRALLIAFQSRRDDAGQGDGDAQPSP